MYKDLSVFIPSYRRAGKVRTLGFLSERCLKNVILIVRKNELEVYQKAYPGINIAALSEGVNNLAQTRQEILDNCATRYCMMLDDDLEFKFRPDRSNWNLKPMPPEMFDKMCEEMVTKMKDEGLVHGAISPIEGHSHYLDVWNYNLRYMRAVFYDTTVVKNFRYSNDCSGCEDFDLALQLVRAGKRSLSFYAYAQTHKVNANGGLDKIGSVVQHNSAMEALKRRHPDFVRLVPKPKKVDKNGVCWVDAVVSWKKAYESSFASSSSVSKSSSSSSVKA